ncbi:hypothetical protein K458DRAFT_410405 [Lentithecium fluviatile CBS 122367]|uniref:Uncharacterized protein n=1 Tax=Lentithecium fluviatile CBS 122367 TaxID=1168545 RepID=A0A6G1IFA1_9PLEO|nr:hypothetical protein K458DRAFT_410405 [Lentithecium fluviatile CBS 122367]
MPSVNSGVLFAGNRLVDSLAALRAVLCSEGVRDASTSKGEDKLAIDTQVDGGRAEMARSSQTSHAFFTPNNYAAAAPIRVAQPSTPIDFSTPSPALEFDDKKESRKWKQKKVVDERECRKVEIQQLVERRCCGWQLRRACSMLHPFLCLAQCYALITRALIRPYVYPKRSILSTTLAHLEVPVFAVLIAGSGGG